MWLWWFCVAWFVFLMVLMTYFVVKYRRRKGRIAPVSASHNTPLEVAWTVIPTLMLVYIFFQGFRGYMDKMVSPGNAIELNLTAQQWSWTLMYPNGAETTTTKRVGAMESPVFYVPGDTPIRLKMNSRDVSHGFWVPDFRHKQDVLPNRYMSVWFNCPSPQKGAKTHPLTREEGKASGVDFFEDLKGVPFEDHVVYCSEYCGDRHSEMAATLRSVPYEAWKKWLSYIESPDDKPLLEIGKLVYTTKCASCHSLDGSVGTGPTWKDKYGFPQEFTNGSSIPAVDDDYIRESILYPTKRIVKGFGPNMALIPLKDRQMLAVIEFMKSVSSHPSAKTRTIDLNAPVSPVPGSAASPMSPAGAAPGGGTAPSKPPIESPK